MKAQPRRVLHVLGGADLGGVESLCLDLVRGYDRARVEPEVLFLSGKAGPARQDLAREPAIPVHDRQYHLRTSWLFAARIARLCRERRFEAVVVLSLAVLVPLVLGAAAGGVKRIVYCLGNPPSSDPATRLKTRVYFALTQPLVTHNLACSDYVLREYSRACRLSPSKTRVLWNWCDVEAIRRLAAAEHERDPAEGPVLGMVARLDPIKDHPTVLRAVAELRRDLPAARLRIIGDGPTRPALEDLARSLGISSAVEFLGSLPRERVRRELGRLDLFVYGTTRDEGFGIVLAEAMAAGVPIVAADVGPCREVLGNGECGELVPPADPKALAAAIQRLWLDPLRRKALGERAATFARANYSVEKAARAMEDLICG